ncbi:Cys-tRNA(Pro) deacylase [Planctobacterium marinum]|uniref:Cys-tRNA(Pro) deacylase n=1 Tax=Planctobacterium marinum TaxID=1631968 RepID=UPI001E64B5F2|nr:Cys-tRNA(Pro) deacylase [Planctobacterium marinum]MCC2605555.1 Cys-tRNA(Pro) deacylase [Planctobacterium marinum]
MTPAINLAKKARVAHKIHEYQHDTAAESWGGEAAEKLGVAENRVFKTLVVKLDNGRLAVAVIPVSSMLSMKLMAKACQAKKAAMAEQVEVERATGYVLGGVSPLGQKKRLFTVIDSAAESQESIYISAGRRGLEIELSPGDLAKLLSARFSDLQQ